MKLTLLLSLTVTILLPHIGICEEAERWDKAMIKKAALWRPFVRFIFEPDSQDSQKDMTSAIANLAIPVDPQFDRSIDLTIFRTVASISDWEKAETATLLLGSIMNKFGKQPSVLSSRFGIFGFKNPRKIQSVSSMFFQLRTDQLWLKQASQFVLLQSDGSVLERPYDKDNDGLSFDEIQNLAYLAHLRAWPNLVSEIVPLYISAIQSQSGHEDRAVATLKGLVDKHYERLLELGKQDIEKKSTSSSGQFLKP